jgi:hypothetical protein
MEADVKTFANLFLPVILAIGYCQAQWTQTDGPPGYVAISMVAHGKALIVGSNGGLFRSTDDGGSWTPINNGMHKGPISVLFGAGNMVFAACSALPTKAAPG